MNYKDIITIEPNKRGGKPCIRGMRMTVYDVLAIRSNASLTQTQLAEKLGKPQSFVSKYESGERRLDFISIIKRCVNTRNKNECSGSL